jgi:hypothetical protein
VVTNVQVVFPHRDTVVMKLFVTLYYPLNLRLNLGGPVEVTGLGVDLVGPVEVTKVHVVLPYLSENPSRSRGPVVGTNVHVVFQNLSANHFHARDPVGLSVVMKLFVKLYYPLHLRVNLGVPIEVKGLGLDLVGPRVEMTPILEKSC